MDASSRSPFAFVYVLVEKGFTLVSKSLFAAFFAAAVLAACAGANYGANPIASSQGRPGMIKYNPNPNPSGSCISSPSCNGGGDGGGSNGGSGGGPGGGSGGGTGNCISLINGEATPCPQSTTVARRGPTPGANCWGSPGTLGDNIPQSSTDPQTEIINIYSLEADNAVGQLDVVGWVYQTLSSSLG